MPTTHGQSQNNLLSDPGIAARLLAACPDTLLVVNSDGKIQYANRPAVQMSGYDYDELLGLSITQLVPRQMRRWLAETADQADQLTKVSGSLGKVCRQDGTVVPVDVSVSKVDNDAEPLYLILGREVSDRIELSEELLHAERLRAIGEIASGVAHDFRNLLAGILGRTQLLLMKASDPQMREALQTIEKAALSGRETVNRIMRYAHHQEGQQEFVSVDLSELLKEVIENTRYRWRDEPQRQGKQIEIESRLTSLPSVEGDPSELRQFFTNLVMNACDAMPDGGKITIFTQAGPTTVTVSVADTGQGMSPDVQERIFDSFFTTKQGENLGLGMTLGKQAVHRHGGEITINSDVGEGTVFTVTFPRPDEPAEHEDSEEPSITPSDESAQILVVEDEAMLRELLQESISALGHRATVASCGEEAFQMLNLKHYDLVITDLGMPGIPGSRVAQVVKQNSQQTYVILLTGWDNPLSPAQSRHVDQILTKPVSIGDLGAAIDAGLAA